MDQGLWQDRDGGFWAYGGDFGENAPSDGNFLCNGIVNPDRNPHPAMTEVKHAYQNAAFRPSGYAEEPTAERTLATGWLAFDSVPEDGKVSVDVINRFYFTSLDAYDFTYELTADGRVAASGTLAVSAAPQDTVTVEIPVPALKSSGTEYFLNLYMKQRSEVPGIPAGHVLASDQIAFPVTGGRPVYAEGRGPVLSVDSVSSEGVIRIFSPSVEWVFDRSAAAVTSYKVRGVEYFADGFGLRPNFWRGPNDNDYGNGAPKRLQIWKTSSQELRVGAVSAVMDGTDAVMTVEYLLAAGNKYIAEYRVHPDGVVDARLHFTPALMPEVESEASEATLTATYTPGQESRVGLKARPEVPRIGVRFRLSVAMHEVTWYGRGPGENYIDRSRGSLVGLYSSSAESMYFPYVRPQENGHRSDTRWAAFYGGGNGLMVVADSTIGFSALRNSVDDFDSEEAVEHDYQWPNFTPEQIASKDPAEAKDVLRRMHHVNDIVPQDYVEVCVDMRQQGVAGYVPAPRRPRLHLELHPRPRQKRPRRTAQGPLRLRAVAAFGGSLFLLLFRNGSVSCDSLPLRNSFFRRTLSTGSLCRIVPPSLFHNGSKTRDSLPLWHRLFCLTLSTGLLCRIVPPSLFHNGSKTRDSLPLRHRLFCRTLSTGLLRCIVPPFLFHNGSKTRDSLPLRHHLFCRTLSTGLLRRIVPPSLFHNGSKTCDSLPLR